MLDLTFVSEQHWSSGLVAPSIQRNVAGLPTHGPLTARNGLKRLSRYLDLHLCFYRVAVVTQSKKDTITEGPISPEARLAICLCRLARGDYYFTKAEMSEI